MEMATTGRESNRDLWIFLALLCLWSWPIWLLSGVLPRAGTGAYDFRWLVAQIGVFGPSLAALIVSAIFRPESRRRSLRTIPILLIPLVVPGVLVARVAPAQIATLPLLPSMATVIVGVLIALYFSLPGRRRRVPANGEARAGGQGWWIVLSVTALPGLFLVSWALSGPENGALESSVLRGGALASAWTIIVCLSHNLLLGGSLGEELGWRGFLMPELLRRMNPLAASVVLGVAWGLWHLPIDLHAGFGVEGPGAILMRVIYAIPLTVLFTWFYLRSNGSLLVALLLHASLDVVGDLGLSGIERGWMIFFVFVVIAALIVAVASPAMQGRARPETG
jgi:membrane protease YdiL (CAAX protease family)